MKKSKLLSLMLALVLVLTLTACGSSQTGSGSDSPDTDAATNNAADSTTDTATKEKKEIKIATSSVTVDLANSGKEALEEMGYTVTITVFDDYFLENEALVEGSADANLYQHESFLNNYNQEKGTDIMMLTPKLWQYWSGLYSVHAKSVEELPDGGKVGIATDASNIDLDLRRLQEVGIITLTDKPQSGDYYTILDIVDNPHNYEFVQADHTKYLNQDEYVCFIGSSNTMAASGVDPQVNIIHQYSEEPNALGMCILPENKDEQWVKDLMSAYTSDKAASYVNPAAGFIKDF